MIAQMDSWQWAQEDKIKSALYVVENTNDLESLDTKVSELLANITKTQKTHLRKKVKSLQKGMLNYKMDGSSNE